MTFNKVEPIPVIGVAPDSDPVVCIAVNTSWVEILVGLVEHALWPDFWAGTPAEIDQALSHVIQLAGMMVGGACSSMQYARLFHKSSGAGGSSVVGWQTRVLTHKEDLDNIVSLSSNLFTPISGKYIIRASAPSFASGINQLRLWDATQAQTVSPGIPGLGRIGVGERTGNLAYVCSLLVTAGALQYSLQHYCESAFASLGLGLDANSGVDNLYAIVELIRMGDYP